MDEIADLKRLIGEAKQCIVRLGFTPQDADSYFEDLEIASGIRA